VSDQLHAPAALFLQERTPVTHWTGGWVSPRARLYSESIASAGDRTSVVQKCTTFWWEISKERKARNGCWGDWLGTCGAGASDGGKAPVTGCCECGDGSCVSGPSCQDLDSAHVLCSRAASECELLCPQIGLENYFCLLLSRECVLVANRLSQATCEKARVS
jgi:hypothetical protein